MTALCKLLYIQQVQVIIVYFTYFYWVSQGVCFEKDEVPVDVDALYNDECLDIYGNIYKPGSELFSCCDCFRL